MFEFFPWLLGLAVLALLWWQSMGAKARARRAALEACEAAEVSFIDELAFKGIRLGRDERGQICLKRRYGFEFYRRGDRRYAGEIEMHAERLAHVQLDPYPI
ncbi:DUF3301 domain-containing protein [Salinisphaera sp. T31B1]|uniref:DUF3301 domain-containing protein n=1 Tax=Salinisphaera sp. T31B1 TaxID=727963 RepID=UPI003340541E